MALFQPETKPEMPGRLQTWKSTRSTPGSLHRTTSERLVEVGLVLMGKAGYHASGLQEILSTAGVSRGSFYHYFNSKEEFTVAIVHCYIKREETRWRRILTDGGDKPLQRLRVYFENLIEVSGASAPIPGCLIGGLSLEVAENHLLQRHLSSSFSMWQEALVTLLQEAVSVGEFQATTDLHPLAGFILNSWQGALVRSRADRSDSPLREFIDFLFNVCLGCKAGISIAGRDRNGLGLANSNDQITRDPENIEDT
jgi:TetR/AcrR family transcriptional regulator, transcriptional repressor for nem operon